MFKFPYMNVPTTLSFDTSRQAKDYRIFCRASIYLHFLFFLERQSENILSFIKSTKLTKIDFDANHT